MFSNESLPRRKLKSCSNPRKFEDEDLTEDVLEVAKLELGEGPDVKNAALLSLKQMLIEEDVEYEIPEESEFLMYLRCSKFDVPKAFARMTLFKSKSQKYGNIFKNYHLGALQNVLNKSYHYLLPYRNSDGTPIVVYTRGKWNPSEIKFEEYFLYDLMILESIAQSPINQICGCTLFLDCDEMTYRTFLAVTPRRLKLIFDLLVNSLPVRYTAVHVVNPSSIFYLVAKFFYPFMTPKIKSRVFIHPSNDDYESLHKYISPEILPRRYGGKLEEFNNDLLKQYLFKYENYFERNAACI